MYHPRDQSKFIGGRCFGKGGFGEVCTIDELKKDAEVLVYAYNIDKKQVVLYESILSEFVAEFRNVLVFKKFRKLSDADDEEEGMKLMANVSSLDDTILYPIKKNKILLSITDKNGSNKYTLYSKMDDNIYNLPNMHDLNSNNYITMFILHFEHILTVLDKLHKKTIFHYDIKPENILYTKFVDKEGTPRLNLVIGDYGFVNQRPMLFRGSKYFISPFIYIRYYQNDAYSQFSNYHKGKNSPFFGDVYTVDAVWVYYSWMYYTHNLTDNTMTSMNDTYALAVTFYETARRINVDESNLFAESILVSNIVNYKYVSDNIIEIRKLIGNSAILRSFNTWLSQHKLQ
jgi:serine/threonine protein kinase